MPEPRTPAVRVTIELAEHDGTYPNNRNTEFELFLERSALLNGSEFVDAVDAFADLVAQNIKEIVHG